MQYSAFQTSFLLRDLCGLTVNGRENGLCKLCSKYLSSRWCYLHANPLRKNMLLIFYELNSRVILDLYPWLATIIGKRKHYIKKCHEGNGKPLLDISISTILTMLSLQILKKKKSCKEP